MANFFKKLVSGLTKTRNNIVSNLNSIFNGFSSIDDDFYEELEEILIMSDIGVNTTEEILDNLKEQVKENKIKEPIECKELLIKNIEEQMDLGENAYDFENEKSVMVLEKQHQLENLPVSLKIMERKLYLQQQIRLEQQRLTNLKSGLTERMLIL